MTAEELARLKELESKATKGPWRYAKESRDGKRQFVQSDGDNWNCCRLEVDSDDCDYEMAVANAELIPALRNAAPALIALAEWAEKAKAEIEYALHPGVFGPYKTTDDPQFADGKLLEMCKRCGFGAVMHTVQHLWKIHGPHRGAEHTCAAAADVRDGWIDRTQKLLAAYPKDTP